MALHKKSDRLIIGLDFGTTFSGVAQHYSKKRAIPDDINVIKSWPGGRFGTSDKVPSEIAYRSVKKENVDSTERPAKRQRRTESSTTTRSSERTVEWGFRIRPEEPHIRCMKLFLDRQPGLPTYVSEDTMNMQLQEAGKDAVSVVADYLREVYAFTMVELNKLYVDHDRPAVWSDGAKDAILRASKQAGIGSNISLIAEPEAAAIYTLTADYAEDLHIGDNFVVVDAGGGTFDLISWEIKHVEPLQFEESVQGFGACCGAVRLDAAFVECVRRKFRNGEFDKLCGENPRIMQDILDWWERYAKRNFVCQEEQDDLRFVIPGVAKNNKAGLESGLLALSSSAMASIFEPIVAEIIKLVNGQVEKLRELGKRIAAILLVGGFGESPHLYKVLEEHYATKGTPLKIIKPPNARTAVARGAVLWGAEGREVVLSRKSRRHYGVTIQVPYDPAIHPRKYKRWDDLEARWKAADQIHWYVHAGATISSSQPKSFEFYRKFRTRDSRMALTTIVASEAYTAPAGMNASTEVICTLHADLKNVPVQFWEHNVSPKGEPYQGLTYNIGMHLESGGLRFDLRIGEQVYGDVVAEFQTT